MTTSAVALPARRVDATADSATGAHAPKDQNRAGWLFSAPFLTLYLLFLIGPVLIGLVISLFNTTTVKSGLGSWVGLSNYADVLSSGDFWASMWHSVRSEEHTSELQSRQYLVCRLLLEKKKKTTLQLN